MKLVTIHYEQLLLLMDNDSFFAQVLVLCATLLTKIGICLLKMKGLKPLCKELLDFAVMFEYQVSLDLGYWLKSVSIE